MPRVCSTCCFSAEGTDSGSVSCDDALRSLCPDFKPDVLLNFLEEFCGENGEFLQPETQTAKASEAALSELGILDTVVEVPSETSVVGSPSANVDSINELIQSDHQYHKGEPKAPAHYPFSSNSSTSLLDGRQVVTALPSSMLPDLGTQPVVLAGHTVSTGSSQPSRVTPTATRGRSSKMVSVPTSSANSKLSVATMVDPNMVYSPRPRIEEPSPVDTSVPDMGDSCFLSADMLESLDGLLSFEDLPDFSLLDQKPQPPKAQQTVITPSSTSSGAAAVSKTSQRRPSSSSNSRVKAQQQPAHLSTSKSQGRQSIPGRTETQDEHLSPDSGFTSDSSDGSSDLSDCIPSPGSLNSSDMEGLSWQEDFVNVSMDLQLFPDMGLCV